MSTRQPTSGQPSNARQNEYFIPRDGIDREVITADICRYLGNDALVRPGTYEDKGRVIQGYFVTAYRNLTSAMIADLKADSARWAQERRNHTGARYSESSSRTDGSSSQYATSGSAYPKASNRDSYESAPRYPGSDAPGYSAGGTARTQQYGDNRQPTGYAAPQQYPQAYPPQATDTRFASPVTAGPNAYPGQAYSNYPTNPQDAPYVDVRAHMATSGGYQQDNRISDPNNRGVYQHGGSAYGPGQPQYSGYPASHVPGSYAAQPVDTAYGRQAYPASTQPEGYRQPMDQYQYEPQTQFENQTQAQTQTPPPRTIASSSSSQAQTGNSGSSHPRHNRERDGDRRSSHRHGRP